MLYEFLTANRKELIVRCKDKAAHRRGSVACVPAADNDAPQFLTQLVDTLRTEQADPLPAVSDPPEKAACTEIGLAAVLHGTDLSRQGYPIDLLVHHYGDICQAVTELAIEHSAPISTNEFRILNRSLDDAIAEAVTAYAKSRKASFDEQATAVGGHLDHLSSAQQELLETAIETFTALQTGKLGLNGATASAHLQSLHALRAVADQSVSAARLALVKGTFTPAPKK